VEHKSLRGKTSAVYISFAEKQGGPMRIPELLTNLEFVGRAEGDRLTYHVFKGRTAYLILSANSRGGYNLNVVDAKIPGLILKKFAGEQVTTNLLGKNSRRPHLSGQRFGRLNSLYVMVALGKAKKLKKREGRSMVFKIAAH
jgi:hypothetical protein